MERNVAGVSMVSWSLDACIAINPCSPRQKAHDAGCMILDWR